MHPLVLLNIQTTTRQAVASVRSLAWRRTPCSRTNRQKRLEHRRWCLHFLHEGIRMSQKAGAAKTALQSEPRAHQPGQDVFKSILPDDIEWKPFPAFPPSVRLAVLVGHPAEPAPYTIRVKAPHGAKLMPHKHPEDRVYTVISGVFYIGLAMNSTQVSWKPIRPARLSFFLVTRPISTGRNPASTSPKSPRWARLDWNTSARRTIRETPTRNRSLHD